jgi:Fe-Mn family superoxide dismutase
MRYQLAPISTRPWLLNGLSLRLIESHYENHYGGALRRLNAIPEQLESLDFDSTPGHLVNSLKREELIALNSTLLHELYFASMAFGDGRPTEMLAQALARDFGSEDRWRSEFVAMAKGLQPEQSLTRAGRQSDRDGQPVINGGRARGRRLARVRSRACR